MAERQKYSRLRRTIFGQKHQNLPKKEDQTDTQRADAKSDRRRFFSRLTVTLALVVIAFSVFSASTDYSGFFAYLIFWLFFVWAIWFFAFVVITIPFRASPDFRPNGQRLGFDTLVSGFNWISICGYYYTLTGLRPDEPKSLFDYYYFSTVTFSTLGYGDFNPTPAARWLASSEAIVGNLHLGVLVAAAFLVASSRSKVLTDQDGSSETKDTEA
ncbi:MAG: ion channel [Pseudomonadota bacterium]